MKKQLLIVSIFCFVFSNCADGPIYSARKGLPYLELTAIQSIGPTELKLLFSEPVADLNNQNKYFKLTNASTQQIISIASASPSGQTISLKLQDPTKASPFVLIAGHVFDIHYNVKARDNDALVRDSLRFLADFWPPNSPSVAAWQDSSKNILLLWTPDNRIGNTSIEIWRNVIQNRKLKISLLTVVKPDRSTHWLKGGTTSMSFALKAVNEFGKSDLSAWSQLQDGGIDTFDCIDICLSSLIWQNVPAGYIRFEAVTTCDRVEYIDTLNNSGLVREITEKGIKETLRDSSGTETDSLVAWCP